jgi:hypothetical protein
VVVGTKTDLVPGSEGHAVSEEAALDFIDELVPPLGPPSSLATPEDGEDLTPRPRHVPDHVPSGSDVGAVVHDNGTLDSDASGPVDIILVDETHSTVVHHTIPDGDNDVGADGEDSTPALINPPSPPLIDLLPRTINAHPSGAPAPRSSALRPTAR